MTSKNKPTLFLIPSALDNEYSPDQLPTAETAAVAHVRHFVVENLRHARRYLRKLLPHIIIDECTFFEMGKHATDSDVQAALQSLRNGNDLGVISEAGLPGIADPGNNIVALAHQNRIRVKPLIGPGSVFLALMASGFNGQYFTFHGYLPRDKSARPKALRNLEATMYRTAYTQIFMETPFRNQQMLDDLLSTCKSETLLCIACAITTPQEKITTQTIADWKKSTPNLHKLPVIFLLGRA